MQSCLAELRSAELQRSFGPVERMARVGRDGERSKEYKDQHQKNIHSENKENGERTVAVVVVGGGGGVVIVCNSSSRAQRFLLSEGSGCYARRRWALSSTFVAESMRTR